jgi:hypothetical protein
MLWHYWKGKVAHVYSACQDKYMKEIYLSLFSYLDVLF